MDQPILGVSQGRYRQSRTSRGRDLHDGWNDDAGLVFGQQKRARQLCENVPCVEERDAGRPLDIVHVHVLLHAGDPSYTLALLLDFLASSAPYIPFVTFERSR